MFDGTGASESTLSSVAKIISAVIWPLVAIFFLVTQRQLIGRLLAAVVSLAESANKIKIWQVEIDRDIDKELDKTAAIASAKPLSDDVPPEQVSSARRVDALVSKIPSVASRAEIVDSVKRKMVQLADEYNTTRDSMPAGPERTAAMNSVFARMRALALAARPFVDEFANDDQSAGMRLAAISILQLSPDVRFADWLQNRMATERPFVFFQASVAILAMVRAFGKARQPQLRTVVESALAQIESHKPAPDPNTLTVLRNAKTELESH